MVEVEAVVTMGPAERGHEAKHPNWVLTPAVLFNNKRAERALFPVPALPKAST